MPLFSRVVWHLAGAKIAKGAVYAAMLAGGFLGADWALGRIVVPQASHLIERATVANIDDAVLEVPTRAVRVATPASTPSHQPAALEERGSGGARGSQPSTAFEHARPAPLMVARLEPDEIAALKNSVAEHVVGDSGATWYAGDGETFRTVCVRLCDGAFYPISFSTRREHFGRDEARCRAGCGSPARLFVYRNPGGSAETMMDLEGRSYVAMPTAFAFRRGASPSCSCKAQPWEQASRDRHRLYALEQLQRDGAPVDVAEIDRLQHAVAASTPKIEASRVQVTAVVTPREKLGRDFVPGRAVVARLDATSVGSTSLPVRSPGTPATAATPVPDMRVLVEVPPLVVEAETEPSAHAKPSVVETVVSRTARKGARSHRATARRQARRGQAEVLAKSGDIFKSLIWGNGPNAAGAPRGGTVREVFARNFY